MTSINFKIRLEEKDSIDFVKLHLFRTQVWFVYFFAAFTIIFLVVGIFRIVGGSTQIGDYVMMIIGPVIFVFFYSSMIKTAKKNFAQNEVGEILMEYTVDQEGIVQKSDDYDYSIKWQDIYKVMETKTLISVYVSKVRAMTFPKDKISENELVQLKNLMRNKLDKKKCKIK